MPFSQSGEPVVGMRYVDRALRRTVEMVELVRDPVHVLEGDLVDFDLGDFHGVFLFVRALRAYVRYAASSTSAEINGSAMLLSDCNEYSRRACPARVLRIHDEESIVHIPWDLHASERAVPS